MELRTTEDSIQELVVLYESLRLSPIWTTVLGTTTSTTCPLPPFPVPTATGESDSSDNGGGIMIGDTRSIPDVASAVMTLATIQSTLSELPIPKFRKRLETVDPITNQPRYGEQTFKRVQRLVQTFDFLNQHIGHRRRRRGTSETTTNSLGDDDVVRDDDDNDDGEDEEETPTTRMLQELQNRYQLQLSLEEQERVRLEQERLRQEEEARQEALRQQQEMEATAQAMANRERQAREAEAMELRRQAEEIRQRRLAQERAEQDWLNNIPKGVDGVKLQIRTLQESTRDEPGACRKAITSLYTLFQQINAHPEETKFRRIRRDHEQFQADIGRHKGGIELLIAAGFTLGAIDDVPCYLSKEPNIEKDMDGWSAWFDLLKGTLQVLEEELMKR
jgi:hypothetical protein